jgi:diadenosine tetraphosphate (Ap4A) HIT family hydrolase
MAILELMASEEKRLIYAGEWLRLTLFEDQFLSGYSILYAPKQVFDLHTLDPARRAEFLETMANAGETILNETGARRMNYLIQGNLDPYLHAHIVPRFEWEDSPWREGPAAAYPEELRVKMRVERTIEGLAERLRAKLSGDAH